MITASVMKELKAMIRFQTIKQKTKYEVKNTSHGCDVRIVVKDIYNLFFKIASRSQETEKMCS